VLELKLEVVQVESNPQLVQIVPPNEVVVLISFELTIGDIRGMANLCIPYNSIERIGSKLSANSWVTYGRRQSTRESVEQISPLCAGRAERAWPKPHYRRASLWATSSPRPKTSQSLIVSVEGIPNFRLARHSRPGFL
jgi:hypothetical protein